ncbi:hypothetical protein ACYSNO_05900 [Enterococcus sp. LJL98]
MKIGLTTCTQRQTLLEEMCEEVFYVPVEEQSPEVFYEFVQAHLTHEIYIKNMQDSGLSLCQLAPAIALLVENHKVIHFFDAANDEGVSSEKYFALLANFVSQEPFFLTIQKQVIPHKSPLKQEEESQRKNRASERLLTELNTYAAQRSKNEWEKKQPLLEKV